MPENRDDEYSRNTIELRGNYMGEQGNKKGTSSGKGGYARKAEELLIPIAEAHGVQIYDVDYVKEGSDYYLRAYIDKEGGVTIDDCVEVSRAYSDVLDQEDIIPEAYVLEVSSPGLGRALTKDRHLQYSLGEQVELKLYKPLEPKGPKEFAGELENFDAFQITIVLTDGTRQVFGRKNIAMLRLALDF